ncbi:MAG: FecR domain-containing protein [Paludibacteraceae bacterium]|nr:FecR domain-containing protein [Paludibacteraceae bacterium]MBN2787932.1 FecR domain-containing protein [Paludibacteraceae bacterium]
MDISSDSVISWSKRKEEIWPELLNKLETKQALTKTPKTIYLFTFKYAAAAVIAVLISSFSVMYFHTKTIETSLAKQVDVLLPDNSKVTVYGQSTISYKPFYWRFSRTVTLNGEGTFYVQKGKKFEVISPNGKTIVLGTTFTVLSRNTNYKVKCLSGKVKVIEPKLQNEVIITAGYTAKLKSDGGFEVTSDAEKKQPVNLHPSLENEINKVLSESQDESTNVIEKKKTTIIENEKINNISGPQLNINNEQEPNKQDIKPVEQPYLQTQSAKIEQNKTQLTPNKTNNDKFRASLTAEQIAILENNRLNKDEKRKAFMQSLSVEQQNILKEQKDQLSQQEKKGTNQPVEKMMDENKLQIREQVRENTAKETKELHRQQLIENKNKQELPDNNSERNKLNENGKQK